jgi:voltage-gated potassium channel
MQSQGTATSESLSVLDLAVVVFTVLTLGLFTADTLHPFPGDAARIVRWLDHVACGVFFADFCIRFARAESKKAFLKWGWIDIIASIPFVPQLRYARFVRVLRIIRLLRGVRIIQRVLQLVRHRRTEAGATSLAFTAILLVSFASVSILVCEQDSNPGIQTAEDAVWWSVSTLTTVGYGDKVPVTTEGRILAMILMVAGIGMFGCFSGLVVSLFLGDSRQNNSELESLNARLDAIQRQLDRIAGPGGPPSS